MLYDDTDKAVVFRSTRRRAFARCCVQLCQEVCADFEALQMHVLTSCALWAEAQD